MTRKTNPPPERYRLYFSDRGIPLVDCNGARSRPTITVENYVKWYGLYLIHVDGRVEGIHPDIIDDVARLDPDALHGDHKFSPRLMYRLAKHLKARVCDQSLEIIAGRWILEYDGCYDEAKKLLFFPPPEKP